jgi:Citrate transporter
MNSDWLFKSIKLFEIPWHLDEEELERVVWHIVYTFFIIFCMFAALLTERVGTDLVMLAALAAFMVVKIINVKEALEGFANKGLATVMILFVVAEGINKTGALDWYMTKLLGQTTSLPIAQLRLMIPCAMVSCFLNNTPIVVVMMPIVLKWARNTNIACQQLFMQLSFSVILGGTCTMIGTSTNLVVSGMLEKRYTDKDMTLNLFDLGKYGVPNALIGLMYIVLASPFLLPGAHHGKDDSGHGLFAEQEGVLLGARFTPWLPAAGHIILHSGLQDTGGIYLVSVKHVATGNMHHAVLRDFVLEVGDILYFTSLVDSFGAFCDEHALVMVTTNADDGNDIVIKDWSDGSPKPTTTTSTATTKHSKKQLKDTAVDGTLTSESTSLVAANAQTAVNPVGMNQESLKTSNLDEH